MSDATLLAREPAVSASVFDLQRERLLISLDKATDIRNFIAAAKSFLLGNLNDRGRVNSIIPIVRKNFPAQKKIYAILVGFSNDPEFSSPEIRDNNKYRIAIKNVFYVIERLL